MFFISIFLNFVSLTAKQANVRVHGRNTIDKFCNCTVSICNIVGYNLIKSLSNYPTNESKIDWRLYSVSSILKNNRNCFTCYFIQSFLFDVILAIGNLTSNNYPVIWNKEIFLLLKFSLHPLFWLLAFILWFFYSQWISQIVINISFCGKML